MSTNQSHVYRNRSAALAMALLFPMVSSAKALTTQADLLFNWGEAYYPDLLTNTLQSKTISSNGTEYYFRGPYVLGSNTQFYVGINTTTNPHVFILNTGNNEGLVDLGLLTKWLSNIGLATSTSSTSGSSAGPGSNTSASEVTDCKAAYITDGQTQAFDSQSISTSVADTSGVCAKNASVLTLTNPIINTSGNSSSLDNSSFYGLNAAVLAIAASNISITGGTINTTGTGANGVFATGVGSSVSLKDVTINATAQGGHGVDATLGGSLSLMNVTAKTTGNNGSVIATDRGSGTITVSGGEFTASGVDSAGVYSTGVITVAGAKLTATNGEAVVIEGGNSAVISNSILSAAKGTRDRGIFIFQSFSGDASVGDSSLSIKGGTYTWPSTTGPAFYATNITTEISLSKVAITNNSATLLKASADTWGSSGSNGGNVTLKANEQSLEGDIVVDKISTASLNLSNGSTLKGAINNADSAKSVALTIDANSSWELTADSHISSLTSSIGRISGNGHNVYYKSSNTANAWLASASYDLNNGGKLIPE